MSSPRTGAARLVAGTTVRLMIAGIGTIVIAGAIGPASKGALATLMSVSTIAAVVLGWGLGGAVGYHVATKKWTEAQFNTVAMVWTAVATVVAFALFVVARRVGGASLLAGLTDVELASATAVVLLYSLAGRAVLALKRFELYATLEVLSAASNPLVFFGLVALGADKLSAAVWAWVFSQAVVAASAQIAMLRMAKWRFARPEALGGVIRYAASAGGWNVLDMINLRLDILILRLISTASATGAYALAAQLTEIVWLVPVAIGTAVFPEVADGGHESGEWTARVARLTSAISTVLALAVGVAATALIAIFLPSYVEGIPAVWLLLPGTAAAATSKVLGNDLNARGLPHALLWAAIASMVVTVVGDLTLIPILGSAGAAIVSSIAYSVAAIVLVAHFARVTGRSAIDVRPHLSDLGEAARLMTRTVREHAGRIPGVIRR